jgi:hypothetical protein
MLCHVKASDFRKSVTTALAVLLVCLAGVADCDARARSGRPFVPNPEADHAPVLEGSTWITEAPFYAIRLQRLTEEERMAYLEKVTGMRIDPFASPPDKEIRFISFLVQIENRGESALQMNPIHCWLKTNKGEVQASMGLNDIGFLYRIVGGDLPPAYSGVRPALLDSTKTIHGGESIHGLLIYRDVEPNTKSYHVDVQLSMPNGDTVRFSAPYRRLKKKESTDRDDD